MQNSTFTIDIAAIYKQEHERYLREDAPKRTLSEWFGSYTPWFIVVVALASFLLSAPHTTAVLNLLTPGFGWVGPVLVELSLIYASFERRRLELKEEPVSWLLRWLRWLVFLIAVATNFAGALNELVSQTGLQNASGGEIIGRFGQLPVMTQVGLIMVALMALIVPVIAEVAGHGIANKVFSIPSNPAREDHWKRVEVKVTFQAVYNIYVQQGTAPHEAQAIAETQVRGYFGKLDVAGLIPETANGGERAPAQITNKVRTKGEQDEVRAFATEHRTEVLSASVTEFQQMLSAADIPAGRTLAYKVWKEVRS